MMLSDPYKGYWTCPYCGYTNTDLIQTVCNHCGNSKHTHTRTLSEKERLEIIERVTGTSTDSIKITEATDPFKD